MMEAPRIEKPEPETGIFGVGCAWATTQRQSVCEVQDGLRHAPPIHTKPLVQSVLSVQELLQLAATCCCGYGVLFIYTTCCCGYGVLFIYTTCCCGYGVLFIYTTCVSGVGVGLL